MVHSIDFWSKCSLWLLFCIVFRSRSGSPWPDSSGSNMFPQKIVCFSELSWAVHEHRERVEYENFVFFVGILIKRISSKKKKMAECFSNIIWKGVIKNYWPFCILFKIFHHRIIFREWEYWKKWRRLINISTQHF